ncbi:hypothetical protein HCG51_01290 [Tolypothrix sp. PCC 7910]|uniref:hypothetical protein n=1 Tax=Tolypothrix sp. PCC 7910 TaxID=2099387 RepID=UPI0014279AB0|nr:hypothetical protein [Tolypothrix sp. PCC 7910]QIR35518.1 hypothetical protein HCG51_01290 [Tolypothrix sp. PCC 7910]
MKKLPVLGASLFLLLGTYGFSASHAINMHQNQISAYSLKNRVQYTQNKAKFKPDPDNPNYLRDYGFSTPLPQTGKVTIRQPIQKFKKNRMFKACPANSNLYAYVESTNYQVEICTKENNPRLPKYYFSRAKNGKSSLTIISNDEDDASQLIFKNNGYTYSIYRDGGGPDNLYNAYLEVTRPDGKTFGEALLYLYEKPFD